MKENFEVVPYGSNSYNDNNQNAVSRITNSLIQALNSKYYLPEFLLIFLDDDLIEHL